MTSVSETKSLRSSSVSTTCDNVFLLPKVCLFCNKTSLTVKKVKKKLTKVEIKIYDGTFPFQNNLSMYAEILQDLEMKAKVSDINLGAKEAWYHRIC